MCCRENLASDALQGTFVVLCSLCVFISLVWLREQLVHGGIPVWLQNNPQAAAAAANNAAGPPAADPANNQQVQMISCCIKTKLNLHQ